MTQINAKQVHEGLTVTSTTYETTIDNYVYRLIEDKTGVLLKRVPVDDRPLWTHGVISQIFTKDKGFIASCLATNVKWFKSLEEAQQAIKKAR